ncbi:MAG: NAD(P)/FAD-dependent oxidoreductase [Candidatus Dormibacteria bacterium]
MTRAVVIGGGIAGLTIGWQLVRRGAEVRLVSSSRPRASMVAAGMLAPMPESASTPSLVRLASQALHHYSAFLATLAEDTAREVGFRRCGVLRVAADERQRASLREEVGTYEAAGLPSQWLDPRSVRRIAPGLPADVAGGLVSFDEGQVHAGWLLEALEEAAIRRGLVAMTGEVAQIRSHAGHVEVLLAGGERMPADCVILSAGSWSAALGGAAVPIRPLQGQLLAFEDVTGPEPILYSGQDYLLSKPDGTVLLGGTMSESGFSVAPDGRAEDLRALLPLLWPELVGRPAATRVGLRPAAPDGLPICGPLPGQSAVYVFTGHLRNGFLLCPHGAHLAAREILDGAREPLFATLRPNRFMEPALPAGG